MRKSFIYLLIRSYLLLIPGLFWSSSDTSAQEYFQQEVNINIDVTLNDIKHELDGFETIQYINNSPDSLRFLFFHLWPNAYSDNKTELAKQIFSLRGKSKLFNDNELRGYIDSLDFKVDGQSVRWDFPEGFPDICKIYLDMPLKKGDTISLTTPFHVKIPKGVSSRLGHIGESYQISQWYPKPAVYDRSGWHQMPYLDQGEFYSEFGSYDVSITLPANYVVGATGDLQNEEEKEHLDSLSEDTSWIKSSLSGGNDFPLSSDKMKTLRYTGNRIHDFAWFADKRFHVMKGSLKLPESGRVISTWAMFTDLESKLWADAISYINNAIIYFSELNGDYPYNSFTAIQSALTSGAGMEYPGLTVIGLAGDPYLLDQVIAHEICHTWFYSALGSDERRYPFMDESTATTYESRYLEKRYPGKKLWEIDLKNIKLAKFFHVEEMPVQMIQELDWLIPARNNNEQPGNLAAPDYSDMNYGSIIYNKIPQGLTYMRGYLGDNVFDSIMHDYYGTWKFRHPGPDDLKAIFESHTDKDLSWFFDDLLTTTKRLDYKIVRSENQKILIKNRGEMKSPLVIAGMTEDSICSERWIDGFEGKKWVDAPSGNYSEIRIDPEHKMPELYRLNNNIHTTGIFRKSDPFLLQFLYTVEDPERRLLTFIPAFDWNTSDGFMVGMALNNGMLIRKPVEYFFMPFYTFRNERLAGYGKISYNVTPYNNFIRLATFTLEGTQFGAPGNQEYHKVKIGFDLNLRNEKMINPVNKKVSAYYIAASDLLELQSLLPANIGSYLQLGYLLARNGLINPFNVQLSLETGDSFQKTSAELNYKYSYSGKNNGLDIRVYAGTMLKNVPQDNFYALAAGVRSGSELYLYQGVYPDRFSKFPETFWSRQMTFTEGGLVTSVNDTLGYSRWLCSVSLTSNLPGKASRIPVKPFVNILLNDHGINNTSKSTIFYDAGFKAGIWDFFEIYVPLIVSRNINPFSGEFKDRIRFVFRLDKINSLRSKM